MLDGNPIGEEGLRHIMNLINSNMVKLYLSNLRLSQRIAVLVQEELKYYRIFNGQNYQNYA